MLRHKMVQKEEQYPVPALDQCLAKTFFDGGICRPGRSIEEHCRIVGSIARKLRQFLPEQFGDPEAAGLAPCLDLHDIGKLTPFFQDKLYRATGRAFLPSAYPSYMDFPDHASAGYAFLADMHQAAAEIAGWHHGVQPDRDLSLNDLYGGAGWQDLRKELVHRLGGVSPLVQMPSETTLTLLKGLVAVADWIGSGSIFDDPATP